MIGKVTITMDDLSKIVSRRGLEARGRVQQFIDSEVLRHTDRYVPMDTGTLKGSGIRHTQIGSGEVRYRTPYARRMYYGKHYNFAGAPMRGSYWFERMKADNKDTILRGAKRVAGAK